MIPISERLKRAAVASFQDNAKLAAMTAADRESAAAFYEWVAGDTKRAYADLARLYNLEGAKFLRGQVSRIAGTAHDFGREIGYPNRRPD